MAVLALGLLPAVLEAGGSLMSMGWVCEKRGDGEETDIMGRLVGRAEV